MCYPQSQYKKVEFVLMLFLSALSATLLFEARVTPVSKKQLLIILLQHLVHPAATLSTLLMESQIHYQTIKKQFYTSSSLILVLLNFDIDTVKYVLPLRWNLLLAHSHFKNLLRIIATKQGVSMLVWWDWKRLTDISSMRRCHLQILHIHRSFGFGQNWRTLFIFSLEWMMLQ